MMRNKKRQKQMNEGKIEKANKGFHMKKSIITTQKETIDILGAAYGISTYQGP